MQITDRQCLNLGRAVERLKLWFFVDMRVGDCLLLKLRCFYKEMRDADSSRLYSPLRTFAHYNKAYRILLHGGN